MIALSLIYVYLETFIMKSEQEREGGGKSDRRRKGGLESCGRETLVVSP